MFPYLLEQPLKHQYMFQALAPIFQQFGRCLGTSCYCCLLPVYKHSGNHWDFVKQQVSPQPLLLSTQTASALASILGSTLATVMYSDHILVLGEFWQPEVFSVRCFLVCQRALLYLNVPSLRSPVLSVRLVLKWRWIWGNCATLLSGESRRTMIGTSCSIATLSTHSLKRNDLAYNMSLRDKRPAISHLRYETTLVFGRSPKW
jgi:hypothetical protein